jgi:outer membrane protein assembly factor BamB
MSCRVIRFVACWFALAAAFSIGGAEETRVPVKTGDQWPVFRGDSLQTGVAAGKLPDQLDVIWKFETKDSIEGAAAIVDGVVYFGSFDEHFYAVDLSTGEQKWKVKLGPVKVAPAVRDGSIFVGNVDGVFYCLDAAKGDIRWKFDTSSEITSSANFAGDNVLFGAADETLYCLTKEGKKVWEFKVPGGPVMGTPAVVGERTFVSGCDSTLHVLNTKTGKELASLDLENQTGSSVAVMGDQLYVGTMGNDFLAIDWKKPAITWKFAAVRRQQPFFASAAVTGDLVIAGSRDKNVYGLDRKTGQPVWNFATGNKVDGSPVIVGKRIYVGSFDGNFYVLDLGKGTELQKIKLDGPVAGSPAVAGERLVIGTNKGTLYCLGAKK